MGRYQKVPPQKRILGFVVNIIDALNYDIDLFLIDPRVYQEAATGSYLYEENGIRRTGTTYRCRLNGIVASDKDWKTSRIYKKILTQLTDFTDGWIYCDTGDIDTYGRVLVDLVTLSGKSVRNALLREGKFLPYN